MALTRIDSYFVDLDSLGGITFDDQSGTPTFKVDAVNHRVGIGISNPSFELQVGSGNFGNVSGKAGVAITAASQIFGTFGTGGDLVLRAQRPSDTGGGTITLGGSARGDFKPDSVLISTANTSRMFINSTGNVGIGTTNPGVPLDVKGTDSLIRASETGSSPGWRARIISHNPDGAVQRASFLGVYGTSAGVFAHNAALNAWAPLFVNTTNGSSDGDTVILAGSGSVGIGTTNPQRRLHIYSSGPLRLSDPNREWDFNLKDGKLVIGDNTGSADRFTIDTSGNVGIGTTSPAFPLQVTGTISTTPGASNSGFLLLSGNSGATAGCTIESSFTTGGYGPLVFKTSGAERARIDSSGGLLVGTSSASGPALLQVQTPTTFSTTEDDGVAFTNTSTKTYPTTSSFFVTAGLDQNIELGTAQTINTVTPGGFNFVYGLNNKLTKSAGNTQDIERLYFNGFVQNFNWTDANTCKQYVGIQDSFFYSGINANGRTSSSFTATSITLLPPDGGTQTISNVNGNAITLFPQGTSTINITNSRNIFSDLRVQNFSAGTKTVNITNHAFFDIAQNWGTAGATGTLVATITNLFGLRLRPPVNTTGLTITNNWGLYQEWSSAKNWFAGASNQFPNITTTASGANAFLDSADSNRLYRSTSSLTYKRDVEDLDSNLADQILNLRPVWYRSKCAADCEDWSWYGLIAEEVAEIDPRFVHYGYQEDAYEFVETTETVDLQPDDPRREDGIETEEVTKQTRQLKPDAEQVPNGVAYDRLVVPLLDIIKRQKSQLDSFEARLAALEAQ